MVTSARATGFTCMLLSSTVGIDQRLKSDRRGGLQLLRPSAANNRKHLLSGLHTLRGQLQHKLLRPAVKHNRRESQGSTTATAYSSSHNNSLNQSGLKTYKIVVVPESTSVETFLTQVWLLQHASGYASWHTAYLLLIHLHSCCYSCLAACYAHKRASLIELLVHTGAERTNRPSARVPARL